MASSISQFLTDGGAGSTLQLSYLERKLDLDPSHGLIPSSRSPFNKPVLANMAMDHDDPPVSPPNNLDVPTDDVDEMLCGLVAPVLAALEFDIKD